MPSQLRTVLHNGRIIDGTGAVFTGHLVMEGPRIVAVGEGPPPPQVMGDGARVEDWLQPEWGNLRVFSGGRPLAQVSGE